MKSLKNKEVLPYNEQGREFLEKYKNAYTEIHREVIELDDVIEQLFVAALAGGHVILEGEPGVGKTLAAVTVSRVIDAKCRRIQFTPEIKPSDMYYSIGSFEGDGKGKKMRDMTLGKGPLFTNILIGDEINRGNPLALSALIEPLEENQITIEGETQSIGDFYFLIATQNPVESAESTNELPEALQERLMLKALVPYPSAELLRKIAVHDTRKKELKKLFSIDDIVSLRNAILEQYVLRCKPNDPVIEYVQRLIFAIHDNPVVRWGPGIRAAQDVTASAAAYAFLQGESHLGFSHVKKMVYPAIRFKFLRDDRKIGKLGLSKDIRTNDDIIRMAIESTPIARM